jgi:hypothetical protein
LPYEKSLYRTGIRKQAINRLYFTYFFVVSTAGLVVSATAGLVVSAAAGAAAAVSTVTAAAVSVVVVVSAALLQAAKAAAIANTKRTFFIFFSFLFVIYGY